MSEQQKDPYAGLTLPEPPKGYRLARWGEKYDKRAKWWDCDETGRVGVWRDKGFELDCWGSPWLSVYAVPIESTLPKTWQFREEPWTAPEPKTLADCPEGVDAIVTDGESQMGEQLVMRRRGEKAYYPTRTGEKESCFAPHLWAFVRYLDPQPSPPLTLEQVPDGRVIQVRSLWYWRVGATWWRLNEQGGLFPNIQPKRGDTLTPTNLIAEFK